MNYEINNLPAMRLAGLSILTKNENAEIPALWDVFIHRIPDMDLIQPDICYGLELFDEKNTKNGVFEYVTCARIADDAPIPDGMIERYLPASRYAVFKHYGDPTKVHQTFMKIYHEFLPISGLTLHEPMFDMEVYTQDFKPGSPDSILYIYIAIQ